jgi:hypothetical protein
MKKYIIEIDREATLPCKEGGEFLFPELEKNVVADVIESQNLAFYYVLARGYRQTSSVLYELKERNLLEYALGLIEGSAIKSMGEEFFIREFGYNNGVYLWRSAARFEDKVLVPALITRGGRCHCDTGGTKLIWRDVADDRYTWNDFHYLYNKEKKYKRPSNHDLLQ